MQSAYYRYPTLHGETILFVSEDDLWSVPRSGGVAHRLTSTPGSVLYPSLSPDGTQVAFVGTHEGDKEVYLMAADGGPVRRMTFLGGSLRVVGWSPDGSEILFASNYGQPFEREFVLYAIAAQAQNGEVRELPCGPARSITFGPAGQVVLGRFTGEPANWKRYRGGTAGQLWISTDGVQFERFMRRLGGNITAPMWMVAPEGEGSDDRIYFVSDHEGVGNLYSCLPNREDIRRHTDHEEFYARNPSTDGRRIVYHAGADLYVFDPRTDTSTTVAIEWRGMGLQHNRRFVEPTRYLDFARLHPSGRALSVTTRGKCFAFYNHEGPVMQIGERAGVRYRLPDWLNDEERLVLISDAPGEECLEIHSGEPNQPPRRIEGLEMGRPVLLKVSPREDKAAIVNHRNELLIIDLSEELDGSPPDRRITFVDRSLYGPIGGMDWSPDGQWIAYSCSLTPQTAGIRLYRLERTPAAVENQAQATNAPSTGDGGSLVDGAPEQEAGMPPLPGQPLPTAEAAASPADAGKAPEKQFPNPMTISHPVLRDVAPAFDPDGNYLYFLSFREFNPVYDALHLDLGFPWGMRPYLITLRADLPNPFVPHPELNEEEELRDPPARGKGDPATPAPPPPTPDAPSPDAPSPDAPSPDAPSPDAPSPDAPSPDAPSPEPQPESDPPAEPASSPAEVAGVEPAPSPAPASAAASDGRPDAPQPSPARKPRSMQIDLDGIARRVLAFPVPDGTYGRIQAISGKAIFTSYELSGTLDRHEADDDARQSGTLRAWSFKDFRSEVLADHVTWFDLSRNRKRLIYASGRRLRVIPAGEKPPAESGSFRRSGWIDLSRIKVAIEPQAEWQQMFREAWRLQRDHFWTEDMASVDWHAVYKRYFPLIARVSTRHEFSDLLSEMQGELGTSHTYEMRGDFPKPPNYRMGFLGASLRWDGDRKGYRVEAIVPGDPWIREAHSPLAAAGVDVKAGDILVAVNGQPVDESLSPAQLLVNQDDEEVLLTFAEPPKSNDATPSAHSAAGSEQVRSVVVRTLRSETAARYRTWVDENRRRVHELSRGRVGYVHIPDMGPRGYAEFHRGYLAETDRDAMVIDVRYNGGGHVSQLILEKLARRRIGYESSRWGGVSPYPADSVAGPLVALTNEYAGSDGDIFCHSFKILKLGPLVGKRTWGGVVGINPRHPLVDGTMTTQPEYGFWFQDVGWNVENYGTDPDIEVDITPQDYAARQDPQLERAVAEALRLLAQHPVLRPDFATRPTLALPKLPPRNNGANGIKQPETPEWRSAEADDSADPA